MHKLAKDAYMTQEQYEKQMDQLKSRLADMSDKKQQVSEQKLQELVSKYEREKFELMKQHTKVFHDLVEETNERLKSVEIEYNEQYDTAVSAALFLHTTTTTTTTNQANKQGTEKYLHISATYIG